MQKVQGPPLPPTEQPVPKPPEPEPSQQNSSQYSYTQTAIIAQPPLPSLVPPQSNQAEDRPNYGNRGNNNNSGNFGGNQRGGGRNNSSNNWGNNRNNSNNNSNSNNANEVWSNNRSVGGGFNSEVWNNNNRDRGTGRNRNQDRNQTQNSSQSSNQGRWSGGNSNISNINNKNSFSNQTFNRQKTPPPPQQKPQIQPPSNSPKPIPQHVLDTFNQKTPEEIAFDEQFKRWEEGFDNWKKDNLNHPDKRAYMEYEKQFEDTRAKLTERRKQMRKNKLERLGVTEEQLEAALKQKSNPQQQVQDENKADDVHIVEDEPMDEELPPTEEFESSRKSYYDEDSTAALGGWLSKSSAGIPGLDLVDDSNQKNEEKAAEEVIVLDAEEKDKMEHPSKPQPVVEPEKQPPPQQNPPSIDPNLAQIIQNKDLMALLAASLQTTTKSTTLQSPGSSTTQNVSGNLLGNFPGNQQLLNLLGNQAGNLLNQSSGSFQANQVGNYLSNQSGGSLIGNPVGNYQTNQLGNHPGILAPQINQVSAFQTNQSTIQTSNFQANQAGNFSSAPDNFTGNFGNLNQFGGMRNTNFGSGNQARNVAGLNQEKPKIKSLLDIDPFDVPELPPKPAFDPQTEECSSRMSDVGSVRSSVHSYQHFDQENINAPDILHDNQPQISSAQQNQNPPQKKFHLDYFVPSESHDHDHRPVPRCLYEDEVYFKPAEVIDYNHKKTGMFDDEPKQPEIKKPEFTIRLAKRKRTKKIRFDYLQVR